MKSLTDSAVKASNTLTSHMKAARFSIQILAFRPSPRFHFALCESPRTKPDKQTNPVAPSTHDQMWRRSLTNPDARWADAMLRMK